MAHLMCLARGAARSAAYGMAGAASLATVGLAQVVHLRSGYVSPEEPCGSRDGCAGAILPGNPLRLLFVGDSVCMGVGANCADPLQAACAKQLATLNGVPVKWRTVAATGADVRELRTMLRSSPSNLEFDVAVVICGVNDGKKLLEGRLPSVFRDDLGQLCADLKRASPEGRIAVPRIPGYMHAPQLQWWPMLHVVRFFFATFEHQKEAVAESAGLDSPSPLPDQLPGPSDASLWASDGIHPSGEGYRIVGEWLASSIATA